MQKFEKELVDATYILNSKTYPIYIAKRLPVMLGSLALTSILISGCSQNEYSEEQSSADVEYSVTDQAVAEMEAIAVDEPSSITTENAKLSVENLSDDTEQRLGSQVADIQIAGKDLLITASANFKVKDVVKSSAAIENLTRQQGGYVALSHISNQPNDSRTFVQDDKNITITTYTRQAEMTVRVPRVNVNKFLAQLQPQVAFLNEQEFIAEDVTLDIYRQKLASQLGSDMADELSQERLNSKNAKDQASNVDSISATYAARQQQEYAKLEQMNIADKVKFSTIELVFAQPDSSYKEVTQNLDIIIEAERPSFGTQVSEAFKQGWDTLKEMTITLIRLWWLAALIVTLYLIYKVLRNSYRQLVRQQTSKKRLKRKKILEKKVDDNMNV